MEAPQGGFFLSKIDFTKPAITLDAQLDLLRQRGLEISDVGKAKHFLQFVGYYRLSGYYRYYTDPADPKRERFVPGISFEQLVEIYNFDRRLRALFTRAFERVEVAVKATLSDAGAQAHGPFWLCEPSNFDRGSHRLITEVLDGCVGDRNHPHQHMFINQFMNKYSQPYPPSWMMTEIMSFGSISKIYKFSKGHIRQAVSSKFDLQHDVMESWLHSLSFARNVCAHHNRIWNRAFTIKPKIPRIYSSHWPTFGHDKLFVICGMTWHLTKLIDNSSPWASRLEQLIDRRPGVPLKAMGFPDNWREIPPWNFH
ncbi:Abi family protein [Methylobacterium sp. J-048]|uniref:Abi family protein n=1 Tax=Methylobacterium sp. J-048 TaxID=2836635 RepID=UPI001FBB098A|nr:Abi family protein [Methylobacterium sp. J-048]MCJ2054982.1 Abi family protein [Methylobacterium sp. J-048]